MGRNNLKNTEKFRNRLDAVMDVTRDSEELTYHEVISELFVAMMDCYMETVRDELLAQIRAELQDDDEEDI